MSTPRDPMDLATAVQVACLTGEFRCTVCGSEGPHVDVGGDVILFHCAGCGGIQGEHEIEASLRAAMARTAPTDPAPPMAGVDPEMVEATAGDLEAVAAVLEGSLHTLRGLASVLRASAKEAR